MNYNTITNIHAREILDSRGNPTVEVEMKNNIYKVQASAPSGASTGKFEALELRDGNKKRFGGKGVLKAVDNIRKILQPEIIGFKLNDQEKFDKFLIKLDGTKNKSKLGANALIALSIAYAKLSAANEKILLYKYFADISNSASKNPRLMFNVINGGAHAGGTLDFQEYQIIPEIGSIKESVKIGSEIYHSLKEFLKKEYGPFAANIGDEGGFAPPIKDNSKPFEILSGVIKKLGYEKIVKFGLDAAASQFFYKKKYCFNGETMTTEKMKDYYKNLIKKYPLIFLEDPFEENDFKSFAALRQAQGVKNKTLICGDDLTVTNVKRIKIAVKNKSCDAVIIKPNQIGTIWETLEAVKLARKNGWQPVVSHRSGETGDDFIADLAFGIGAWGIKAGAPARGERVAKYNQFLRIEEECI